MNIIEALADPQLLGASFPDLASWRAWVALLKAAYGIPMNHDELGLYREHTGRENPPSSPPDELWIIVGRRGGKSRITAATAVFSACFRDYSSVLARGERGIVAVMALDRRQAGVLVNYVKGIVSASPLLSSTVSNETKDGLEFANGTAIEVQTANFRAVRGHTLVAAICDELAFWRSDESANPDTEVLNAVRPAMATVPGSRLICISSPYATRGELYRAYSTHFGDEGHTFVWQADSRAMNPTLPARVIDDAYARDSISAAAEYGAQFRGDLESFVSLETLEACTMPGRPELKPAIELERSGAYVGFVDPSGGSQDSFTLAIAHAEDERVILDLVKERRPPFSPDEVVADFAETLRSYGISSVTGDRYGGEFCVELFSRHGIYYEASTRTKSELYREMLPLMNARRVELLDHERLRSQLAGLERRTSRAGRDAIDHAPGSHDDVANAVAGAFVLASAHETLPSEMSVMPGDALRSRLHLNAPSSISLTPPGSGFPRRF